MKEYRFINYEYGINIYVNDYTMKLLIDYCENAKKLETGGILIGKYLNQVDVSIEEATGPTDDSVKRKTRFIRGTSSINSVLKDRWSKGLYYIGEWHYHPNGSVIPSNIDIQTMKNISKKSNYKCPEPILVIIGENYKAGIYVIYNNDVIRLEEVYTDQKLP